MKNIANFSIFFISSIICTLLIPNPYSFIKINEKSPVDIYAPYDIKIYKTLNELKAESIKVISQVYPVLVYEEYNIESKEKSPLFEFLMLELRKYLNLGIVSDEDHKFLQNDLSEKVAIYVGGELYEKNKNNILSFSKVYDTIISQVKLIYPDSVEKVKIFLLEHLKPNLKLDKKLTQENRMSALNSIEKYKYIVNKGELIVKKGERVDEETYEKIKAIYQNKNLIFKGFLIVILFILWGSINLSRKSISISNNLIINSAIVLFSLIHSFIINAGYSYLLNFSMFFNIVLVFLIPKHISINYATTSSILLGIYFNMDFYAFVWTLAISLSSILLSNIIKKRYEILLFGIFLIPLGILLQSILKYEITSSREILLISISVIISLFLAFIVLLVIEKTTRLTTKFNLLDISDLEHPLIQMLRDKAPGTYNHSINVSILAQEAAEEIGANALLCKVGSYFHDIGKIKNPEYFIENQTGYNPHDELDPVESAKIVIGHVIEGVKIAKKFGLPNAVIDIIRTHHGTSILEPFYKKAILKNPDIDKKLFQYPGPNPRTREEAIVMLADSVEAAVRSLKEKDKDSIKKLVREILNNKWESGYLENTDLKKRDIEKIEEVFIRVLESIYHPRIAYD
ncbi:MAG: HDIG domain-containing metalloprotein [candidate division WOR-3 bacterium]